MIPRLSARAIVGLAAGFFAVAASWFCTKSQRAAVAAAPPSVERPAPPLPVGYPTLESPQAAPIALSGVHVFVANTAASTLDVIHRASRKIVARVPVGIDPVSVAARPDGKEVWVSNHVSDSVSVVDTVDDSPTFLQVIATIQEFDPKTRATRFDEPVGIAFASNTKAYVALSSDNQIAVVDIPSRRITRRLDIPAQDPRAIVVRGDRLYVVPFESGNKTQLSGGNKIDGDLVTFNIWDHSIRVNNVLSLGHVVDIVKHPRVPDRDLFVFDTKTDERVAVVDTLGTLLYGLAVDSHGAVYIAQTDARNDANGRSGSKKHDMRQMDNRAFLNRITRVGFEGDKPITPRFFDLEPLPPAQPASGQALATPFAIQISDDDSTLVATAGASDRLFTVDAQTGDVLGRVEVGAGPHGIALESAGGKPARAWVLNAFVNTVSLVDVSNPGSPRVVETIALQDPTHPAYKRGRIAFNTAKASTTGTYACASCHPDGHTDQLLWVLQTPIVTGGNQIMPRSTMPIRGLRDTEPYHWDGTLGDPYGGINSASINKPVPPTSKPGDPISSARDLIDSGLATTMLHTGDTTRNDEGKLGALSARERNDMAVYILGVPYPPSRRRSYTDEVSKVARDGFRLFHIDGDADPTKSTPNVCGNCHRMPFLTSTNTPGTGMDAPTWRGAQDRWLILPQGRLNVVDLDFYRAVAERGAPERSVWRFSWAGRPRFDPIWNMVEEMSTGFSEAFGRQLTVNKQTARAAPTSDLLNALERAARDGAVVLEGEGVILAGTSSTPVALQFDASDNPGRYVQRDGDRSAYSREALLQMAEEGRFVGTITARHGVNATVDTPQPALWTLGPIHRQRGRQLFPILHPEAPSMTVSGRHFGADASVYVDGHRVPATIQCEPGEKVTITLSQLPSAGMHLVQVQAPRGLFSNDLIFHVAENESAAVELRRTLYAPRSDLGDAFSTAVARNDLASVKKLLASGAKLNAQHPTSGSTPLRVAAVYGHLELARFLIEQGAEVSSPNNDGNTALHGAAFLCHPEIVRLLLDRGASTQVKNQRGETPIDVVSAPWSEPLADAYAGLDQALGLNLDLKRIEQERPRIARLLREQATKGSPRK